MFGQPGRQRQGMDCSSPVASRLDVRLTRKTRMLAGVVDDAGVLVDRFEGEDAEAVQLRACADDSRRIYSTLAGRLHQAVEVFRDIGDAERWLATHTEPAP